MMTRQERPEGLFFVIIVALLLVAASFGSIIPQDKGPCVNNPCKNNGLCNPCANNYFCLCPEPYRGTFCQSKMQTKLEWSCNFENHICGGLNVTTDQRILIREWRRPVYWQRNQGCSNGQGVCGDHTKHSEQGSYLLFNTQRYNLTKGEEMTAEYRTARLRRGIKCVSFHYIIEGKKNSLIVQNSAKNRPIFKTKAQTTSWTYGKFEIYALYESSLRFIATSLSHKGYVALDDIVIKDGFCWFPTLKPGYCNTNKYLEIPYFCDFNKGLCHFRQTALMVNNQTWQSVGDTRLKEERLPKRRLYQQKHTKRNALGAIVQVSRKTTDSTANIQQGQTLLISPIFNVETLACVSFYYIRKRSVSAGFRVDAKEITLNVEYKDIWNDEKMPSGSWQLARFGLVQPGSYQFYFRREEIYEKGVAIGIDGPVAIDDFRIDEKPCQPMIQECHFEEATGDDCGYINDQREYVDWNVDKWSEKDNNFLRATVAWQQYSSAVFWLPAIYNVTSTMCLKFNYKMRKSNVFGFSGRLPLQKKNLDVAKGGDMAKEKVVEPNQQVPYTQSRKPRFYVWSRPQNIILTEISQFAEDWTQASASFHRDRFIMLQFELFFGREYQHGEVEVSVDDIQISVGQCETEIFRCDFDQDLCNINSRLYEYQWQYGDSNYHQITLKGPAEDHTQRSLDGGYLYFDPTGLKSERKSQFSLPKVRINNVGLCIEFHVHVERIGRNHLYLKIQYPANFPKTVWELSKSQGDEWVYKSVYINHKGQPSDMSIMFEAEHGTSRNESSIALDDINVTRGLCPRDVK